MNNFKSLEKIESEYMYWGKVRSVQTNIIWKSSDGRFTHLVSLNDEHLVNTIRSVYEKSKMASELSFIDEIQEYEGVKYSEWLRLLTNEYRYRKSEAAYSNRMYEVADDYVIENSWTRSGEKQMNNNLLNTLDSRVTIEDVAQYLDIEPIDEDNYELDNYYLNGVRDESEIMF